jgi:hypothetical protein
MEKELNNYYKRSNGKHRNECTECHTDKQMQNNYGISLSTYDLMFIEQGGVCAICHLPQKSTRNERLAIDHCHETGKVRGLLCDGCNRGIGLLKDDYRILSSAASYLRAQDQD